MALESYFRYNCNVKHVNILTDNGNALAYIKNMGGMYSVLFNNIAKYMRELAQKQGFRFSSNHILDVENIMAGKMFGSLMFGSWIDALPQNF